jgi:hypothetical protein
MTAPLIVSSSLRCRDPDFVESSGRKVALPTVTFIEPELEE